jgi:hypothetical protein
VSIRSREARGVPLGSRGSSTHPACWHAAKAGEEPGLLSGQAVNGCEDTGKIASRTIVAYGQAEPYRIKGQCSPRLEWRQSPASMRRCPGRRPPRHVCARHPTGNRKAPGPSLKLGSDQYYTDSIGQTRAGLSTIETPPNKTSEPHLYFPRRREAFQSERTQRACPPIGPHGRTGTMPRMRRGDVDQTG